MNIFDKLVSAGIPVPEEFYDNYVCVELCELARKHSMSIAKARLEIDRLNLEGETYLTIFNRVSDGVEMVSGYIFKKEKKVNVR